MSGISTKARPRALTILLLIVMSLTLMAARPGGVFPESISLPDGFQPEGIAVGTGTTFYVGSIPTGAVYRGDLATGEGAVLVAAQAGRQAIGMKYDERSGLLFVAGGLTGHGYVYDGGTGANVADIQLTTELSFVNDVVVTREAAYFTDSFQPVFYRIALDRTGQLPEPLVVQTIPLGGDFQFKPGDFNANGIAATSNGDQLIIVNSTLGTLYLVNPTTGDAALIDLHGGSVPNGDGILLSGKTLYVVQNSLNQIAVIKLSPDLSEGTLQGTITSPLFRVPTTIARFGDALYAVNARFGTPPAPDTDYDVVRVSR
jgi:sugar lactone lactonase YvrE